MNLFQICDTANLRNKVLGAFLALFLSIPVSVLGCDACGCASTMSTLQVLPFFNSNMVGIFGTHAQFTHPDWAENNDGDKVLNDHLVNTTFMYRSVLNDRLQFFYELPFQSNTRLYEQSADNNTGIGDMAARLTYALPLYQQEGKAAILRLSPRISAPTGSYMSRGRDRLILPMGMQLGTGAWSFGGTTDLTIRRNALGLQLLGGTQHFTTNEMGYALGLRSTASANALYFIERPVTLTVLQFGLMHEAFRQDTRFGSLEDFSGGHRTSAQFSLSTYLRKWAFQGQLFLPIQQSIPADQPSLQTSASVGVMYFLGR